VAAAAAGGEEETMPKWGLAVAVGPTLVAVSLFLWHRFHPW